MEFCKHDNFKSTCQTCKSEINNQQPKPRIAYLNHPRYVLNVPFRVVHFEPQPMMVMQVGSNQVMVRDSQPVIQVSSQPVMVQVGSQTVMAQFGSQPVMVQVGSQPVMVAADLRHQYMIGKPYVFGFNL